jgi:hypothetical protein
LNIILEQWCCFAKQTVGDGYIIGEKFDDAFWRMATLDSKFRYNPHGDSIRAASSDIEAYQAWAAKFLVESISGWGWGADALEYTLASSMLRRRFFITQRGYLGLGPAKVQAGDEIFIFAGSLWPLIL